MVCYWLNNKFFSKMLHPTGYKKAGLSLNRLFFFEYFELNLVLDNLFGNGFTVMGKL
jgi:hypothetical protein